MAQRAIRNTYGFEAVGYGQERRLLIIAGQVVPPHLRLEDPTAVIDELGINNPFYNLAITPVAEDSAPQAQAQAEAAKVVRRRGSSGRYEQADAGA